MRTQTKTEIIRNPYNETNWNYTTVPELYETYYEITIKLYEINTKQQLLKLHRIYAIKLQLENYINYNIYIYIYIYIYI